MNAIEKLIDNLRQSRAGFAKMIGVSRIMVFHYVADRCMPSLPVANRILKLAKRQGIDMTLADIIRQPKKRKKSASN